MCPFKSEHPCDTGAQGLKKLKDRLPSRWRCALRQLLQQLAIWKLLLSWWSAQVAASETSVLDTHMEVLLTTKVERSKEPYSQLPRQNCIISWYLLVHASFSVNFGWTDQVKFQTLTCANIPHDFYVAERSLLRRYPWSRSHSNSEWFGRLFDKVIGEGRQLDHSSEKREIVRSWRSSKFEDFHGAQALLIYMTMTMTHSNEVSTWCQPCPTDSNGEVVTSAKEVW